MIHLIHKRITKEQMQKIHNVFNQEDFYSWPH
jgi:hypothetical protein